MTYVGESVRCKGCNKKATKTTRYGSHKGGWDKPTGLCNKCYEAAYQMDLVPGYKFKPIEDRPDKAEKTKGAMPEYIKAFSKWVKGKRRTHVVYRKRDFGLEFSDYAYSGVVWSKGKAVPVLKFKESANFIVTDYVEKHTNNKMQEVLEASVFDSGAPF